MHKCIGLNEALFAHRTGVKLCHSDMYYTIRIVMQIFFFIDLSLRIGRVNRNQGVSSVWGLVKHVCWSLGFKEL